MYCCIFGSRDQILARIRRSGSLILGESSTVILGSSRRINLNLRENSGSSWKLSSNETKRNEAIGVKGLLLHHLLITSLSMTKDGATTVRVATALLLSLLTLRVVRGEERNLDSKAVAALQSERERDSSTRDEKAREHMRKQLA